MRYIAISWNRDDKCHSSNVASLSKRIAGKGAPWSCDLLTDGLAIYSHSNTRVKFDWQALPSKSGVIIGTIFEKHHDILNDQPCSRARLSHRATERIVASNGEDLISNFWGSYAAFIINPETGDRYVVRSPMNGPLVLSVVKRGLRIYFSSLVDALALGVVSMDVDWEHIESRVAVGITKPHTTGISGVSDLGLGECIVSKGEISSHKLYWNPCAVARSPPIEDEALAASSLRAATESCLHSWAANHESILVKLSGGFDSSILASCLSQAPSKPRVACLHYHWPGPRSDELQYAREAAKFSNCELIEVERRSDVDLKGITNGALTVSPSDFAFFDENRLEVSISRDHNATAICCGTLGDALFHLTPAAPAVVEFLRRNGFRANFLDVAIDAAQLDKISIWRVLRFTVTDLLWNAPRSNWNPYSFGEIASRELRLTTQDLANHLSGDMSQYVHPWLREVQGVPDGKLWQIRWLPFDEYWRNPFTIPGDPLRLPPYASQPFAEVCLRIPTYLSIKNGWDRAVARRALGPRYLPEIIRRRITKGSPDSWTRAVINHNANFIREFLLNGILVNRKYLDPQMVDEALPGNTTKTQCHVGLIIQHLCTEAWLRRSLQMKQQAVA